MTDKKLYWFKRKRYGWGWVPVSWQGWILVGLYLLIIIGAGLAFLTTPSSALEVGLFILFFVAATFNFLKIALSKAPEPHWRWGRKSGDKSDEDF